MIAQSLFKRRGVANEIVLHVRIRIVLIHHFWCILLKKMKKGKIQNATWLSEFNLIQLSFAHSEYESDSNILDPVVSHQPPYKNFSLDHKLDSTTSCQPKNHSCCFCKWSRSWVKKKITSRISMGFSIHHYKKKKCIWIMVQKSYVAATLWP